MSAHSDNQPDDRDTTNYVAPPASTDSDLTRYSDAPADPNATAYTPASGASGAASAGRLPRRFGNYQLLEELGHGGMGVVYRAREFTPERIVALKVIRSGELADADDVRRFRQEADEAARLDHPHIVPVYEVGEHAGLHFFTMKLAEGGSLSQHLERYRNDPKGAAKLTAVAARAVHYAHQRQLLHRDLKPGNILLDAAGQPHVADFGLAKRMEEGDACVTRSNAVVGTPEYMAPEQARGEKRLTTAADVYALGGVLYALLTGRPPFRGVAGVVMQKVLTEEPTLPSKERPGMPRDLETICLKCLHKEPARRYGSAEALAEDLERWLRGEPVRARPLRGPEWLWKWMRRNPVKTVTTAAMVLVLLGFCLSVMAERRRENENERHVERLKQDDAVDRETIRGQLENGRFADAEKVVGYALERLQGLDEPALAARRRELTAQRERIRSLANFYHFADQAWFQAGEEKEEAEDLCDKAFQSLDVLNQPEWWNHLPSADLNADQVKQLQQEVYGLMFLFAGLKGKPALMNLAPPKETAQACREAEVVLKQAQDWEKAHDLPPSKTGLIFTKFFNHTLRPNEAVRQRLDVQADATEPTNAVDYFFLGMFHYFLAKHTRDPVHKTVVLFLLTDFNKDLDLLEAQRTAERFLRTSCRLDPRQYWPHFILGWTLNEKGDFVGAESAFDACVALRPDNPLGYEWRALAVIQQVPETNNEHLKQLLKNDLRARALSDSELAMKYGQTDPATWWTRGDLLKKMNRAGEALEAYAKAMEVDIRIGEKISRRDVLDAADAYAREQIERYKNKPDEDGRATLAQAYVLLALDHFRKGDADKTVLDAAAEALKIPADHARAAFVRAHALAARGSVALNRGNLEDAMKEFASALQLAPDEPLAAVGRARVDERRLEYQQALTDYDYLLSKPGPDTPPPATTEELCLEVYLGRYRALVQLGRFDEAREALAQAEAIDRRAAKAQGEGLPIPVS
jgi:tetratricopeptide (TPR) repeat protein